MNGQTVVLADDHAPTRMGVRMSLEAHGFVVCADVGSAGAAVEAALQHRPDVCVLDVDMPGSGIVAAREIGAALPDTAVVMLTVSRTDDDLFAALQAGAIGYLLKDTSPERLPLALTDVLAGEAVLPRALVTRLVRQYQTKRRRRRLPLLRRSGVELSEREWEVLELLTERLSTKEIAERLDISPVTVRRHVSAVLEKLDVSSREEAIDLIADEGGR